MFYHSFGSSGQHELIGTVQTSMRQLCKDSPGEGSTWDIVHEATQQKNCTYVNSGLLIVRDAAIQARPTFVEARACVCVCVYLYVYIYVRGYLHMYV